MKKGNLKSQLIKILALQFFLSVNAGILKAEETVENLLSGYLKNNLTVKQLSSEMENQILESKASKIENGMDFHLESGTVTIQTGSPSYISLSPSANLSIPKARNLTLSISSDVEKESEESFSFTNSSIALEADLYSKNALAQEIIKIKADRAVLEAKRALQNGFVTAEKEFYTELKSLFTTAASIVSAEEDLYEDQIEFNEIKAKGYSSSSIKYRQAQMEVLSDQRTVEINRHDLERQTKIFAAKCGIEYKGTSALSFLPSSIPQVSPVKVSSFSKDDYTEIESAKWTNYINSLERKADSPVTIRGSAGYTIKNTSTSGDRDTVDLGSSLTWNDTGLTANAGVSLPVSGKLDPVYTFGFSFEPNAFLLADIEDKQDKIAEEQERIAIDSAKTNYRTSFISQNTSLADIKWEKETNLESFKMYESLTKDTERYYKDGYLTESEYKSAAANKENYRLQCIINDIELIIYNDETKLLFCRDEELKHERKRESEENIQK